MQTEMTYIYEVYRSGSFSQAAKKLFLSQPALSISVRKVEDAIGVPLFDRDRQPLALTPAGEIYIRRIEEILRIEDDLAKELQDFKEAETGTLILGGTQYFNAYFLPPALREYHARFPGVRLELSEDNSSVIDQWMSEGKLDIGFHSAPVDEGRFQSWPVGRDELLLAVPRALLPADVEGTGLTAEQVRDGLYLAPDCPRQDLCVFAETPLLILTESNQFRERTLAICQEQNFQPSVLFCIEQLETSWHFARSGLGAAFVTDRMAADAMDDELLYFKLDSPRAVRTFHAIVRKHAFVSRSMREFIGSFAK